MSLYLLGSVSPAEIPFGRQAGMMLVCNPNTWEVEAGLEGDFQLHLQLELYFEALPTQTTYIKSFLENKRIK